MLVSWNGKKKGEARKWGGGHGRWKWGRAEVLRREGKRKGNRGTEEILGNNILRGIWTKRSRPNFKGGCDLG